MDCAPFPAPLSPLPVSVLRYAPDAGHLDEAEHFLHNRKASVASLRSVFGIIPESRSASLRKGVRLQRNPQYDQYYQQKATNAASDYRTTIIVAAPTTQQKQQDQDDQDEVHSMFGEACLEPNGRAGGA